MKKKIVLLLFAVAIMPLSLLITACGGPSQEVMYDTICSMADKMTEFKNSFTIEENITQKVFENGQFKESVEGKVVKSFDSSRNQYFSAEIAEDDSIKELNSAVKNVGGEYHFKDKYNSYIVDDVYAYHYYAEDCLNPFSGEGIDEDWFDGTYEEFLEDIAETKAEYEKHYEGVSYTAKFSKSGAVYKFTLDMKYSFDEDKDGVNDYEKYDVNTKILVSFTEDKLVEKTFAQEYTLSYIDEATNQVFKTMDREYVSEEKVSYSFDDNIMTKISFDAPTEKFKMSIGVYTPGNSICFKEIEIGESIDSVVAEAKAEYLEGRDGYSFFDGVYKDSRFKEKLASGSVVKSDMVSYYNDSFYVYIIPYKEDTATIVTSYIIDDADNMNISNELDCEVAEGTYSIVPYNSYYRYDEKFVVNGTEISTLEINVEKNELYFVECYAYKSEEVVERNIYVHGELVSTTEDLQNYCVANYFIKNSLSGKTFAELDLSAYYYGLEVYKDAEMTQKFAEGEELGNIENFYCKITPKYYYMVVEKNVEGKVVKISTGNNELPEYLLSEYSSFKVDGEEVVGQDDFYQDGCYLAEDGYVRFDQNLYNTEFSIEIVAVPKVA